MVVGVDLLRDQILKVRQGTRSDAEAELADFAGSAAEAGAPAPDVPSTSSVSGACGLCGAREASARCANCEKPVCSEDLWVMYGLCHACLPEEELRRARSPEGKSRPDLGVKWVED